MKDKRILYVSSEVLPFLPESEMSLMSFEAPKMVNSHGGQIRIFMPRFGNINERRHQLHEVIRLSGANLVINDLDMPLIIKVATIPRERMQVYFIENEDYFRRKATFTDEEGNLFPDNDERVIFFTKGVIETVKKLNWSPDIIHVHGWMASLLPLYMRNYYGNEPLFMNSKIVTSIYNNGFEGSLDEEMEQKVLRSEEHTSELQSRGHLVCRLLLEKKNTISVQQGPEWGIGSGFNEIELGFRLRYEIKREIAPYIGIDWHRKLGINAD